MNAKSPLPVDLRRSKRPLIQLNGLYNENFSPNEKHVHFAMPCIFHFVYFFSVSSLYNKISNVLTTSRFDRPRRHAWVIQLMVTSVGVLYYYTLTVKTFPIDFASCRFQLLKTNKTFETNKQKKKARVRVVSVLSDLLLLGFAKQLHIHALKPEQ